MSIKALKNSNQITVLNLFCIVAKFEFNCDTGKGRGREKTPKLAVSTMFYFLKHPHLQQKKNTAPMALVSAAALITEQLAFAEILKL